MTKEQLRLGATAIAAFGILLGACHTISPPEQYAFQRMQSEYQTTYDYPFEEQQVASTTPLRMSYYLRKMEASVRTVNGKPTPAPTKPLFRGWAQEKFYSENKTVLAKYRAGNLDELINVLNNQRKQQFAAR